MDGAIRGSDRGTFQLGGVDGERAVRERVSTDVADGPVGRGWSNTVGKDELGRGRSKVVGILGDADLLARADQGLAISAVRGKSDLLGHARGVGELEEDVVGASGVDTDCGSHGGADHREEGDGCGGEKHVCG